MIHMEVHLNNQNLQTKYKTRVFSTPISEATL